MVICPGRLFDNRRDSFQQCFELHIVTAEAGGHGGDHFVAADFGEVDEVACLFRQLCAERALNPAIAVSEGMGSVDFACVVGQSSDDGFRWVAEQEILLGNLVQLLAEVGFDLAAVTKTAAALADVDSAQLPGPVLDILKQMTVDRLQVG